MASESQIPTIGNEFESTLAQHQAAVFGYVRSLLPGYPGAEDVAQEVLMTIWKKREEFEVGTNFKAWAFRIAHFHVLNQRRKIARGNWLVFDEELLEKIDPTESAELSENDDEAESNALDACLEALKPEDRELLHTRYATKVSLETFAEQEGTRPGTLKARLFRLRSALRTCIEKRLATP